MKPAAVCDRSGQRSEKVAHVAIVSAPGAERLPRARETVHPGGGGRSRGPRARLFLMTSIDVHELTKDYGPTRAVDRLTFSVGPGRVTGFLGPNGAGKSTTMRLVLGLDRPTAGTATLDGRPYAALETR